MPQTAAQKFRIKENACLRTVNAPEDFALKLAPLPVGVTLSNSIDKTDQVHWFVKDKAQVVKEADKVVGRLEDHVLCWIYFPKGTSGIQTDLTRDKGWETLEQYNLQFITLVSFDQTWSAFGMRRKTGKGEDKKTVARQEHFAGYVHPETKTVTLPDDLKKELGKHPKLKQYFDALPFSHKREYIEWIVSAKKKDTREKRISGMMERLEKGWKNPAGR